MQKAYRTLRLEIASPNNDALTAEISEDEEWEEHDWRWKVKYEKEKALDRNVNAKSQKKREEAFWRVRDMKRMAKMKEEGVGIPAAAAGGGADGQLQHVPRGGQAGGGAQRGRARAAAEGGGLTTYSGSTGYDEFNTLKAGQYNFHPIAVSGSAVDVAKIKFVYKSGLATGGF